MVCRFFPPFPWIFPGKPPDREAVEKKSNLGLSVRALWTFTAPRQAGRKNVFGHNGRPAATSWHGGAAHGRITGARRRRSDAETVRLIAGTGEGGGGFPRKSGEPQIDQSVTCSVL